MRGRRAEGGPGALSPRIGIRTGLVLGLLVGCHPTTPAPGWHALDTLSVPGLAQSWGDPLHVDALSAGGSPRRTIHEGGREAVWWPDGHVHRLTWAAHPVRGRQALPGVLGVPREWIRFRPDSLVAVVRQEARGILMVALDNGDHTWSITWTSLPRPAPSPASATERWLQAPSSESSLSSPAAR